MSIPAILFGVYLAIGVVTLFVLLAVRRRGGIKDAMSFLESLVMDLSVWGLMWLAMLFWPAFVIFILKHPLKKEEPIQLPETTRGK